MFAYVYSKIVQNARRNARGAFVHGRNTSLGNIFTLNYNPRERANF